MRVGGTTAAFNATGELVSPPSSQTRRGAASPSVRSVRRYEPSRAVLLHANVRAPAGIRPDSRRTSSPPGRTGVGRIDPFRDDLLSVEDRTRSPGDLRQDSAGARIDGLRKPLDRSPAGRRGRVRREPRRDVLAVDQDHGVVVAALREGDVRADRAELVRGSGGDGQQEDRRPRPGIEPRLMRTYGLRTGVAARIQPCGGGPSPRQNLS